MRSLEIPFSELKKYLEERGEVFEPDEYITDVFWQMEYPEQIVFVKVDSRRIGLDQMTMGER
jgi:hypothetical protein